MLLTKFSGNVVLLRTLKIPIEYETIGLPNQVKSDSNTYNLLLTGRDSRSKMLESPTSATPAAAAVPAASVADPTTAQHQQMARKIENGDFAEDYFASLTGPAKRLIEVRKI